MRYDGFFVLVAAGLLQTACVTTKPVPLTEVEQGLREDWVVVTTRTGQRYELIDAVAGGDSLTGNRMVEGRSDIRISLGLGEIASISRRAFNLGRTLLWTGIAGGIFATTAMYVHAKS